jgi:MFS family permease
VRSPRAELVLLAVVVALVGGLVGVERATVPSWAFEEFGVSSTSAALSFIASFGLAKATFNLLAGPQSERFGRKRVLLAGWLAGVPVPVMMIVAPSWAWVIVANVLLGVSQALTWSMLMTMKLDIVGRRRRGIAAGLNEFAGYGGLALAALTSAVLASYYGLRAPFVLGAGLIGMGVGASLLASDTTPRVARSSAPTQPLSRLFVRVSLTDRSMSSACLAGLITNLKDGMLWGLLPLLLGSRGLSLQQVGAVVAVYPATWGLSQLVFGPLSDRLGRRPLVTAGMLTQAVAVIGLAPRLSYTGSLILAVGLGLGTAMVYPVLQAQVVDAAGATVGASALSVYRFWRDLGYAASALLGGAVADTIGMPAALAMTSLLCLLAGVTMWLRAPATADRPAHLA